MVASSLDDVTTGLIPCREVDSGALLPAVIVYGANASGKSNLVSALSWMRSAVMLSHSRGEPGGGIPITPFRLDDDSSAQSTSVDIDFVIENLRFHYGFEASKEQFVAEWLYAYPHGRRQMLYQRDRSHFRFGRALKGQNRLIARLARPNSLYLAAAAQNGHEYLSKISDYFRSIKVDRGEYPSQSELNNEMKGAFDQRVLEFLEKIGTGIVDYEKNTKKHPDRDREFERKLHQLLAEHTGVMIDRDSEESLVELQMLHKGYKERYFPLSLQEESNGTRKLIKLLHKIINSIDFGGLVVVDEIDTGLHTQACESLLGIFASRAINQKGAQLIATTHDTNLLRSSILRRDQVWFTEKTSEGATHLYPLTDIKTRKGDNIERGYLQGRYGAVPLSGSVEDLISAVT